MFDPNIDKPIDPEMGKQIIQKGVLIGCSTSVKGCYWSIHLFDGKYFISLNEDKEYTFPIEEHELCPYVDRPVNCEVYDTYFCPMCREQKKVKIEQNVNQISQKIVCSSCGFVITVKEKKLELALKKITYFKS